MAQKYIRHKANVHYLTARNMPTPQIGAKCFYGQPYLKHKHAIAGPHGALKLVVATTIVSARVLRMRTIYLWHGMCTQYTLAQLTHAQLM
jgi:hypothetical protein